MNKYIFDSSAEVAKAFADFYLEHSNDAQPYHVALSGGSTPKILFDLIAKDYVDKFSWSNIHFWWGDERCVAPDDDDSNYKMTKERLLDNIDIPEANIHRILGENDPAGEAVRYGQEIEQFLPQTNGLPKFDLIILGMGPDGHTASIFPHEMELLDAESVCAVATHPESGQKRVSLTGKVINNAAQIAFLVTGANKFEKVDSIFEKKEDHKLYPAAYIRPSNGELSWFLDQAAIGK
ncbi:6-phosphogluconolactonase [Marinoscillum sp. MHG1-6]|uniref:6-phosphogluconolactonase n=1 Tax=Marinoscillum sp. MHG1-6 TaxID=2959627 RepID=UPI0021586481|nr:6-phosphogluconolactonase [Marinoscillum sp. MHG1-6]